MLHLRHNIAQVLR